MRAAFRRIRRRVPISVCHALGYPRDVRAVARRTNDRCSHGRGNGQRLRRPYSRALRHSPYCIRHVRAAYWQRRYDVQRICRYCIGHGGLFGVPTWVSVPISAVIVWLLVVKGSYKSVEKIFLADFPRVRDVHRCCIFGWSQLGAMLPMLPWCRRFLRTCISFRFVISMIGTTIAPWMMFFCTKQRCR